ncbi:DUF3347 domain-containing protein [Marivirga sp. S37H4]|uniref:DUF3347 domain-containing protein n=1 Tax=Marivirga aurantiaca TaxID=2802615 RepID=A0A935C602_9BACT|nr:DUF3347 domain-containing protein [Marivirga aurantiaca]MBK6264099.1 DUF3347 domain-containing protein [Marivirga aurantiaca]
MKTQFIHFSTALLLVVGPACQSCQSNNEQSENNAMNSDSIVDDRRAPIKNEDNPKVLGADRSNNPKTTGTGDESFSTDTTQAEGIKKEKVQQVITYYLELKDALVKSDNQKASEVAAKIKKSLEGHNNQLAKNILFEAEQIALIDNLDHQRTRFNTLSENVYTLVNSTKANQKILYRQYCPMAFDNEGAYWLSAEEEIRNPYFGDKMLKCGSVKETLE